VTERNDDAATPPPGRLARHGPFLAILGSAMLLRLVLAYVAFPGQGFATDIDQFGSWATVLAQHGPGAFYAQSGANYPPGYMYVLWFLGVLSGPVGSIFGISSGAATLQLLKLPPMLADAAIGILL
jgi:dolichyl-phosphate-mannose-protein mannosyltransferase